MPIIALVLAVAAVAVLLYDFLLTRSALAFGVALAVAAWILAAIVVTGTRVTIR